MGSGDWSLGKRRVCNGSFLRGEGPGIDWKSDRSSFTWWCASWDSGLSEHARAHLQAGDNITNLIGPL